MIFTLHPDSPISFGVVYQMRNFLILLKRDNCVHHLTSKLIACSMMPKLIYYQQTLGYNGCKSQRLNTITPDPERFPTFNPKLQADMYKETKLFLTSIFREDRSLLDILDTDYTYLNQRLSGHYGIWRDVNGEEIKGNSFKRVSFNNPERGGILTQASILTVTSNPTRTSPVKRGRWVLEQILGTPSSTPSTRCTRIG